MHVKKKHIGLWGGGSTRRKNKPKAPDVECACPHRLSAHMEQEWSPMHSSIVNICVWAYRANTRREWPPASPSPSPPQRGPRRGRRTFWADPPAAHSHSVEAWQTAGATTGKIKQKSPCCAAVGGNIPCGQGVNHSSQAGQMGTKINEWGHDLHRKKKWNPGFLITWRSLPPWTLRGACGNLLGGSSEAPGDQAPGRLRGSSTEISDQKKIFFTLQSR